MNGVTYQTVLHSLPEMILLGGAVVIYMAGAFLSARRLWTWVGAAVILAAAWMTYQQAGSAAGFEGPLVRDALSTHFRWLTLLLGGLFLLATSGRASGELSGELVGSLLLVLGGVMLVAGAGDLILVFLGLEMVSIPTYILLYIGRRNRDSQESAVKYFYLSIVSSAILLYGFSFLFGVTGSTSLAEIIQSFAASDATQQLTVPAWGPLAALAMVLIFAGLAFKIAAAPFHFYAPDVYQGTTNANAALLAVAPKIVGIVAIVRIAVLAFPAADPYGLWVAIFLAVASMTFGNTMALWQTNLRRLLAYSSIAHAGYMLIGIAVAYASPVDPSGGAPLGLGPVIFYVTIYSLATVGAFACLAAASDKIGPLETTHDAAGLSRRNPFIAALLTIFLLTLAGIPPAIAGFWGKLLIFSDAIRLLRDGTSQYLILALAIIGVLNAAIAAAYYLRVAGAIYFRPAEPPEKASLEQPPGEHTFGERGALLAALVSAILVIAIGFAPGLVVDSAQRAADGAVNSAATAPTSGAGQAQATSTADGAAIADTSR